MPDATLDPTLWWARIRAAEQLWQGEAPVADALERAVDGKYENVTGEEIEQALRGTPLEERLRSGSQLDVNLLGQGRDYHMSVAFDRFPTWRFAESPSDDARANESALRLLRKLADGGDLVYAMKRAMDSSMTRGPLVLWPLVIRNTVTEKDVVASSIPPAAYTDAARSGTWDGKLPDGADCKAISLAVDEVLFDPTSLALPRQAVENLWNLKLAAVTLDQKKSKRPHPLSISAKLWWEATPYGSWCLVDPSVTDYSRVAWVCRKIVMTVDEFKNDPTFTDEAKEKAQPFAPTSPDNRVPATSTNNAVVQPTRVADETGRIVIREVWDKIGWRRFYLVDGYDKIASKDTKYPYMTTDGVPLFYDFFPCVWRTPLLRSEERPTRVLGKPLLEEAYGTQIAFIKNITAYIRACEASGRTYFAAPGVSDESLNELRDTRDSKIVRLGSDYNPTLHGTPDKQFTLFPTPPAPLDYLRAAEILKNQCATLMKMPPSVLTSESAAPTAYQEEVTLRGPSATQADLVRCYEDACAEATWKGLLMFLHSASPEEFAAYCGQDAIAPREDGRPPIVEVLKGMDFPWLRLECRFDSTTRAENAMRLKTRMDLLALANNVRDQAGMPYVDLGLMIRQLFREADVEFIPYTPTEMEKMMMLAQMQGAGVAPNNAGDQRPDSRRANGERGTPNVPGRQSRGRESTDVGNRAGAMARRATATS